MEVYTDEQEQEVQALLESTHLYQSGLERIASDFFAFSNSLESVVFIHNSWTSAHGKTVRDGYAHR
jgi:hypothetical protein